MHLVTFLLARLDEDEQAARAATPGPWTASEFYPGAGSINSATGNIANESAEGDVYLADAEHIAHHDPARVLAEVEAKRRMMTLHSPRHFINDADGYEVNNEPPDCDHCLEDYPCPTLRLLALPYTEHPDCQQGRKP